MRSPLCNHGFRTLVLFGVASTLLGVSDAEAGAVRAGFDGSELIPNDDGSTGLVPIGFPIDFFGIEFEFAYVNNNGNITFDAPLATFTPFSLTSTGRKIIAPFFADVDTSVSGDPVAYGTGTVDARAAFGATYSNVDCYLSNSTRTVRNTFQVILIERAETGPGNFDIEFNYDQIQWEAGQASGGNADCLGGATVRVGYSNGTNAPGSFFELAGSGVAGAFLDNGPGVTALIHNSINSDTLGRYVFEAREGTILPPVPDADGDGVPDDVDECNGFDDLADADTDGVADGCDACDGDDASGDEDGDFVCDEIDACDGNDATGDADLDFVCDDLDACDGNDASGDSDDDLVCDDIDACEGDDAEGDTDADLVCDDLDLCDGDDATGDTDGDAICNDIDACEGNDALGDSDGDAVCDDLDQCTGDDFSGDSDSDGHCDTSDNCPGVDNPDQIDVDIDGIGNACEADSDSDGEIDDYDNCPYDFNTDQANTDGDAEGDACDADDDDDGVEDLGDNCPVIDNPDQGDTDGDGGGDACDGDDDGDGVIDDDDICPATPAGVSFDSEGCSGTQRVELECDSDGLWLNHGAYVSCVVSAANDGYADGLLSNRESAAIKRAAAQSAVGH